VALTAKLRECHPQDPEPPSKNLPKPYKPQKDIKPGVASVRCALARVPRGRGADRQVAELPHTHDP
jgi:hypothetical protein